MRIALVTLRFDAPGGVESNVRAVAAGLVAAGEQVTIYASDLYDEARRERRAEWAPVVDGVPVRRFPVFHRLIPGLTMPLMVGLIDALAADRPDVIHAHSHRYGHVLESGAVAARLGIPLVVSTHYHPADREEPGWKRALLRVQDHLFGMTVYRTARRLVVESEFERELLAEFAPTAGIRSIAAGLHLKDWKHPADDRPPPGLPDRYILYAGRIARNKGLPTLIDALAAIPAATRPALVIVGRDWGLQPSLEAQAARRGVAEAIRFLGHLEDRGAYRAVFRGARAFVLPSEYEAFGLVLLEAMAADLPIVATAVGGMPELLENGRFGQLVPYGAPEPLARAIQRACVPEPDVRAMREAARSRVAAFDWSVAVDAHRSLYRELLPGASA